MRESKIERDVVTWARKHDIVPLKLTPYSDGGWPDRFWLFYYPAIAFIEFKAPGKWAGPRQQLRIAELQRRGYPTRVIDNYDDGVKFLEAEILSKHSSKAWDHASLCRFPDEPWDGKDNRNLRDIQDTKK